MPKKSLTTRALINKLDRVFSRYIRMKDADEGGTVSCVTCGRLFHWSEVHCGHWIKRQHQSVRFREENTGPQCVRCNLHMGGCQDEYAAHILRKYGQATFDDLLAKKREAKKWTRGELESLIEEYTQKVSTLELGRIS